MMIRILLQKAIEKLVEKQQHLKEELIIIVFTVIFIKRVVVV